MLMMRRRMMTMMMPWWRWWRGGDKNPFLSPTIVGKEATFVNGDMHIWKLSYMGPCWYVYEILRRLSHIHPINALFPLPTTSYGSVKCEPNKRLSLIRNTTQHSWEDACITYAPYILTSSSFPIVGLWSCFCWSLFLSSFLDFHHNLMRAGGALAHPRWWFFMGVGVGHDLGAGMKMTETTKWWRYSRDYKPFRVVPFSNLIRHAI